MPLPSQIQLSNTFGEWINTTNDIIKTVGNTSEYILVSQNATPAVSTGNASINGVMTLASLKANGGLGSAGQFLTSNGNNVYWSTLTVVDANSSTSGLVNTSAQNFAGNKTFDNNVAIIGYLTVGNSTITLNSTTLVLGNASSNLVMNSTSVTLDGSQVINSSGTANNAANLNGQAASYYTNASNLSAGTLDIARLDANVLLTTSTTNINASALSTGTVPLARLSSANSSANGVVDTTTQSFAGDKTFQNAASFSNTVSITGAANTLSTLGVAGTLNALGLLGVSGNATFAQDVVVTGNLTISGTTTYINTTNLQIGDNIIALNADLPGGSAPTESAGIEINRGSSANTYFRWNETGDVWEVTNDGTNYGTLIDTRSTTGVNASALSTGTVPLARLSSATNSANGVVDTTTQTFAGNKTFQNAASFNSSLSVSGNVSIPNLVFVDTSDEGVNGQRIYFGRGAAGGPFQKLAVYDDTALSNSISSRTLQKFYANLATDTVGVSNSATFGIETYRHDVGGGIDTSTAGFRLRHLGGEGANYSDMVFYGNGATGSGIGLFTNNMERMRINFSGNVGIGNTAPAHNLRVEGTVSLAGNVTMSNTVTITGAATFSNTILMNANTSTGMTANGKLTLNTTNGRFVLPVGSNLWAL